MTRIDIWKMRLLLHCSFNALFALERARIIEQLMKPTKHKETTYVDSD
jgi:hypothetical protein